MEFRCTVYGVGPYILRDWFQYAAVSETPYPVRHRCVHVRSGNQSPYPVRHRCVRVRSGNKSGGKKWQTFKECVPFLE